jgi:hypothetical protein
LGEPRFGSGAAVSKPYFECHITIEKPLGYHQEWFEGIARRTGWKTSCIDGDPVMGQRAFFYFTCHHPQFESIKAKMHDLENLLKDHFVEVLRSKIEQIVYDTKTGLV